MSAMSSDSGPTTTLSLVAQFDDINRLNNVLNDGYSEECFLAFVKQVEWCRGKWLETEKENTRLQKELDEALDSLTKWEAKFTHVRKLLDGEKLQRRMAVHKYEELDKQMAMARDLLFNDNRTKLNNETLQKLAFLNGTAPAPDFHHKLPNVPELNSTGMLLGTVLSEMSYSRSEDDLDISLASTRRSWVQRGQWNARTDQPVSKKRRSSTNSSATKTVELQGGKVLATATTTLTLERAPTNHDLKPPQSFQPISESSDEAPPLRTPSRAPSRAPQTPHRVTSELAPPSAPPKTDTETASDTPHRGVERVVSVRGTEQWGSPRTRPRQHNFVAKNFYKRENCGPCGKTIKFAKAGVRCETCRATAHPECRNLLPLPCVPPGPTAIRNTNNVGCIADYAPSSPPMVPALLVHCINEVEKRGLNEKGIYRVSATDKEVKRLKERFLRGCGSPQLAQEDIHVLCGCIKDFLRSLREPLITNALWHDFVEAGKHMESGDATASIIQAVSQLPPPNRDTLAFLVLHLQKVAESEECQMGLDNLARVFGPTVIGYGLTETSEMYTVTTQLVQAMKVVLGVESEYWSRWACPDALASPAAPQRLSSKPRGFFYSPADTGIARKKRNYFQ